MSTRATIQFSDAYDTFYVYRHSDGYPENVLADPNDLIEQSKGRWSGSECGCLVSRFLGMQFDSKKRLPDYEITSAFHGDESYKYYVTWDKTSQQWHVTVR